MQQTDTARSATSKYRELPPPPEVAKYLTCVWTRVPGAGDDRLSPRILPDGCIDIVWIGDSAPKVAGPATLPVIAQLQPGAPIVGARLRPGMAACLLGIPASELRDLNVPLREIWGANADRLLDASGQTDQLDPRLMALEELIRSRLVDAGPDDPAVLHAVDLLNRNPGTTVRELSQTLDISSRQLLRRFSEAVGYGPKTFGRILRFQRAIQTARQSAQARQDLGLLAAITGYADQAHMSREFSRLAGLPPSRLVKPNS